MSVFLPHKKFNNVTEITLEYLANNNISALILDVDNTLTTHDNPTPSDGVSQWLDNLKNAGIKLIILSNNNAERVTPFAKILQLEFEPNAKKPLTGGYKRACEHMGVKKENTAVVGDQLFTDILGGKLFGVHAILVELIQPETTRFFKFKRSLEKIFLKTYKEE